MKFANLKIGAKLAMGFAVVVALFVAAAVVTIVSNSKTGLLTQRMVSNDFARLQLIGDMAEAAQGNMQLMAELLISEDMGQVERVIKQIDANRAANAETIKKIEALLENDAEKKRFRELLAQGARPVQRNPETDILLDPRFQGK